MAAPVYGGFIGGLLEDAATKVDARSGVGSSSSAILRAPQEFMAPAKDDLKERTEVLQANQEMNHAAATAQIEGNRDEGNVLVSIEDKKDVELEVQNRQEERAIVERDLKGYRVVKNRHEKNFGPPKSNQQAGRDYQALLASRKRARTRGTAQPTSGAGTKGGGSRQKTLNGSGAAFGKYFDYEKEEPGPRGPIITRGAHVALSGPAPAG